MSIWNAVLQASHSATIDELNHRYPELKLELGLPKRIENSWDQAIEFRRVSLRYGEEKGLLSLSLVSVSPGSRFKPNVLSPLYESILKRTQKEFLIRNISVEIVEAETPRSPPRMLILLPVTLPISDQDRAELALGIGIF